LKTILTEKTIFIGSEPIGEDVQCTRSDYNSSLCRALSWYSYDQDFSDAKKYAIEYLKKTDKESASVLSKIKETDFNKSICWTMRLEMRGAILSVDHHNRIQNHIQELLIGVQVAAEPKKQQLDSTKESNPNDKLIEYLGDIEGIIDLWIKTNEVFDLYNDMTKRNLPKSYSQSIIDLLTPKLTELRLAQTDEVLKEGYSNFSTFRMKKYIAFIEKLLDDVNRFCQYKKNTRKPRAKKFKSPDVLVSKLNYNKKSDEYKVTSIPPENIIGAEQLWVFNVKTRKLGIYRATGVSGLGVDKTKIINFDPETSIQKTIRKPDEVLQKCLDGGKLVLRKLLSEIKAVESQLTGRLNEDVIILRAVK